MTNIVKHASATTPISVVIDRADGMLQLAIDDNGNGFDTASQNGLIGVQRAGGLGLAGMRERLSLIGGLVSTSDPPIGSGTTIFVRIQVEREGMAA